MKWGKTSSVLIVGNVGHVFHMIVSLRYLLSWLNI